MRVRKNRNNRNRPTANQSAAPQIEAPQTETQTETQTEIQSETIITEPLLLSEHIFQEINDIDDTNLQHLQHRQDKIIKLNQDVTQLQELFVDLKQIVKQQDESLDIVDEYITITKETVQAVPIELIEAENIQSNSNRLKYYLIGIPTALIMAAVTFAH